jgi:hypothetical protein
MTGFNENFSPRVVEADVFARFHGERGRAAPTPPLAAAVESVDPLSPGTISDMSLVSRARDQAAAIGSTA